MAEMESTNLDRANQERQIGSVSESTDILANIDQYAMDRTKETEKRQLALGKQMDLVAGKPPRSCWDDLDTSFVYTLKDIPIISIPLSKPIKVKVAEFNTLDDWTAVLYDTPWRGFRQRLHLQIKKYCKSVPNDPAWVPEVGQVLFVRIPKSQEMDNLRILELGKLGRAEWQNHPDNVPDYRNPDEQDKYAGLWARATFLGKTSQDTRVHTSCGFNVRLLDFGRDISVHRHYGRKAVWRFLPFPAISVNLVLLIHGAPGYTPALHAKWKKILRTDSIVMVRAIVNMEPAVIVDLVSPTEKQYEKMYKAMLNGKVDESLLPVANPIRPEEEHLVQTITTRLRQLNTDSEVN